MINKSEFDLLLQEIIQIENKIEEIKILNKFEEAKEFEKRLETVKQEAKNIVLDDNDSTKGLDEISFKELFEEAENIVLDNNDSIKGFDEISFKVLSDLINIHTNIDYYILTIKNIIEDSNESKIDVESLKKIEESWKDLKSQIDSWNSTAHNPIENIEYDKYIAKTTLDIMLFQLQISGIIDFPTVFKYCKIEFLVNSIKEVLYEGAKNQFEDEIKRHRLTEIAKNLAEKDIYDYKVWQQVLMIKNIRSRDDHIEMLGNPQEQDKRKYVIEKNKSFIPENIHHQIEMFDDESILKKFLKWISDLNEVLSQKKMESEWKTSKGPAFKCELIDGTEKYVKDFLDVQTVYSVRKLTVASNGIGKYSFAKNSKWASLEEVEFLEEKNACSVRLSPDDQYNCIGSEVFANCEKLRKISFGRIEIIGEKSFANCPNLNKLVFSKSIINIGDNAFLNCKNLTEVRFLSDLKVYILKRPQNVISCFRNTNLKKIVFYGISSAFDFAIVDCPNLEEIIVSNMGNISVPFKTCRYRQARDEGIVCFIGEKSLSLWKNKNNIVRFYELKD